MSKTEFAESLSELSQRFAQDALKSSACGKFTVSESEGYLKNRNPMWKNIPSRIYGVRKQENDKIELFLYLLAYPDTWRTKEWRFKFEDGQLKMVKRS